MKKTWMKRMIAISAAAAMALPMAACGSKSGDSKSGEKQKFIVGFDAAFPPYGYQDENGEYVGFDLDLAAEVCNRNDWELVKQPIDWDTKDMELNSGTISCIWNGFTMNGREDEYAWTDPYVDNSQVFVVKSDSGIASFADLAGKSVAVQTDSSAEAALKEDDNKDLLDSFKELVVVADYNTAFMNLDSDAVNAIAMDIGVAKYQMESRDGSYTILDDVLSAEQYAVGFAKNNTELRDKVQKTLNDMRDDGTFQKIAEKWDLTDSIIQ
ncbi:amino acid ABC transporter substrate-binding protein [Ruminococcus sp.]|jgi:polar amino acid transport system substrate-binding protein|uniref:amino acid ABC transporter substrate-binding protein n=1 Tax=Ruminococcus sp. TaxID=41978 RepID=UPI00262AD643|nr:amino acid ABC transporter substrate-binding protein [Ruminococcus sp.]MEE0022843.1 amino acid ABC transporter substrate-binding protein [Ruminococcus sp.]